jgi:hypothetical protein
MGRILFSRGQRSFHPQDESDDDDNTNHNDQVGSEKRQNKFRRVVQMVGQNEHMNPETHKEQGQKQKDDLADPP